MRSASCYDLRSVMMAITELTCFEFCFFPVGYIYPVLAYTFCKKPSNTREQHKKAYVARLDARKAFDTVWHECLFVKLHNKRLPMHAHMASTLYMVQEVLLLRYLEQRHLCQLPHSSRCHLFSTPSSLTSSSTSSPPQNLEWEWIPFTSEHPCMYADNLALIAESPQDHQSSMLNIMHSYVGKWDTI